MTPLAKIYGVATGRDGGGGGNQLLGAGGSVQWRLRLAQASGFEG